MIHQERRKRVKKINKIFFLLICHKNPNEVGTAWSYMTVMGLAEVKRHVKSQGYEVEESTVESKSFTWEPVLLPNELHHLYLSKEPRYTRLRNSTLYLRQGMVSYRADNCGTGLSKAKKGSDMGTETEVFSAHHVFSALHTSSLLFGCQRLGSESSSISSYEASDRIWVGLHILSTPCLFSSLY